MSSAVIESLRTLLGLKLPVNASAGRILTCMDGEGTVKWQDVIPTGTKMLFYQNTVPDGWDLVTGFDAAGVFLNVVNAAGSAGVQGGGWGLSIGISDPGHNHNMTDHNHQLGNYGWAYIGVYQAAGSPPTSVQIDAKMVTVPSWAGNRRDIHNGGQPVGSGMTWAAELGGIAGNMTASYNTGSRTTGISASTTHGATQHRYANVICCSKRAPL